jgi:adenine deaminase
LNGVKREALIDVAMGYEPADLLILNGKIVNTHTGTIHKDGIAIKGDRIAAVGDVGYAKGDHTEVIDAGGQFLVPGLIDPHCHQWHTYCNSTVFATCRLLHGSTAIVDGFYGHAIVNGIRGSRFFRRMSGNPCEAHLCCSYHVLYAKQGHRFSCITKCTKH